MLLIGIVHKGAIIRQDNCTTASAVSSFTACLLLRINRSAEVGSSESVDLC